jgi:outer membrane immunogenic protein
MKKLVVALSALVAFTGSALAADMAPRTYSKAPPPAPLAVTNWTGCYVGAGGGGAMTKNDHNDFSNSLALTGFAPGTPLSPNLSTGADGWFGTVQVGCDYQFNNFVVGVFGDYDFMSVKGDIVGGGFFNPALTGSQKQDSQWAVGGRAGYLVLPQLLTYVSGGYTQAHWTSTTLYSFFAVPPVATLPGATKGGWFIGTGDEYALSFLPGLFWKTEYRYSEFDRANVAITTIPGAPIGVSETQRFREHSVRSELVYRFNWGGPVVAKY